jgi:hypothetical protein
MPLTAALADDGPQPEETQKLAVLEVELSPTESVTIAYPARELPWGSEATLVAKEGEHEHKLVAKVQRKDNEARVVLRYTRDGTQVFDKVTLTMPLGADATHPAGESKVKVKVSEKKPREKVDMPDGNDPLDGVL